MLLSNITQSVQSAVITKGNWQLKKLRLNKITGENRAEAVSALLQLFMTAPGYREACVYGDMRFTTEVEYAPQQLAPPHNRQDRISLLFGRKIYRSLPNIWFEGALTRSVTNPRPILALFKTRKALSKVRKTPKDRRAEE